jgi:hypothetical protein
MKMASEIDSIRALATETSEAVVLTREFYQCVVQDPRRKSGEFQPVLMLPPPPEDIKQAVEALMEKNEDE